MNYVAQLCVLQEENATLRQKDGNPIPSTPTIPDPTRLSRAQPRMDNEHQQSRPQTLGVDHPQPRESRKH